MKVGKWLVMAAVTLGVSAGASAEGLPTKKVLTLEVAQMIAEQALATCRANGHTVSVVVTDPDNNILVALRDDNAAPFTLELSKNKAFSAAIFGRSSGAMSSSWPPYALALGSMLPGTIYVKGGLPIKVGKEVVGAIGVTGAHGSPGSPNPMDEGGLKDEECINAGIAKAADKLK